MQQYERQYKNMNCEHIDVIAYPNQVKTLGNGISIENLKTDSTLVCTKCETELALEDLALYSKEHISVGIPKHLVGKGN